MLTPVVHQQVEQLVGSKRKEAAGREATGATEEWPDPLSRDDTAERAAVFMERMVQGTTGQDVVMHAIASNMDGRYTPPHMRAG